MVERTFRAVSSDGAGKHHVVRIYRSNHGAFIDREKAASETDPGAKLSGTGEKAGQFGLVVAAPDRYVLWLAAMATGAGPVSRLTIC